MTTADHANAIAGDRAPMRAASTGPTEPGRLPGAFRVMLTTEFRLLVREPAVVLWSVLLPVVAMLVLSIVPVTREPQPALGGQSYAEVYRPVLILFTVSMLALQMQPMTLALYREIGVLKRLRTTPASPWLLLGTHAILSFAVSFSVALVITCIPFVLGLGLPENIAGFAASVALATACMVGLGAVVTALVPNSRVTGGVGWLIGAIIWFSAGMWVPRAFFPDWLIAVTDSMPGGAAASALIETSQGGWPNLWALAVLVVWGAVAFVVAVRTFRFE